MPTPSTNITTIEGLAVFKHITLKKELELAKDAYNVLEQSLESALRKISALQTQAIKSNEEKQAFEKELEYYKYRSLSVLPPSMSRFIPADDAPALSESKAVNPEDDDYLAAVDTVTKKMPRLGIWDIPRPGARGIFAELESDWGSRSESTET